MIKDVSHIAKYTKGEMISVLVQNVDKFSARLDKAKMKPSSKAIENEINICNEHIEICLRVIDLLTPTA